MRIKPTRRAIHSIFLHCSASDATGPAFENPRLVSTIDGWHRRRGFAGIGYHFVIDKQGRPAEGRPLRLAPAAQRGHNRGTIAVCLHGLRPERFTSAQFQTLRSLLRDLYDMLPQDNPPTIHGHNEVNPHKACPVYDPKQVVPLNANNDHYPTWLTRSTPSLHSTLSTPTLRYLSRGPAVKRLQLLLNLRPDGLFYDHTRMAVRRFQKEHGLTPDGIVGPLTWAALT